VLTRYSIKFQTPAKQSAHRCCVSLGQEGCTDAQARHQARQRCSKCGGCCIMLHLDSKSEGHWIAGDLTSTRPQMITSLVHLWRTQCSTVQARAIRTVSVQSLCSVSRTLALAWTHCLVPPIKIKWPLAAATPCRPTCVSKLRLADCSCNIKGQHTLKVDAVKSIHGHHVGPSAYHRLSLLKGMGSQSVTLATDMPWRVK